MITRVSDVASTYFHQLSRFTLAITGGIVAVVFGLIAYAAFRFRRRANDDGKEPAQIYGSNPVEMAWTIVPLLIVVVLALATAHVIQEAPVLLPMVCKVSAEFLTPA